MEYYTDLKTKYVYPRLAVPKVWSVFQRPVRSSQG